MRVHIDEAGRNNQPLRIQNVGAMQVLTDCHNGAADNANIGVERRPPASIHNKPTTDYPIILHIRHPVPISSFVIIVS